MENRSKMESNRQLELAYDFVQYTQKNVFLTGKAGTGKTTFLHQLRQHSPKRMAVVAPTGVAAINANGVTIHSFFQLPFGPYIPKDAVRLSGEDYFLNHSSPNGDTSPYNKKFNKEKIKLIRSLDLLVIDEISMVRADMLDGIDDVLRRYRDPYKPFGGLQLLMIGDLHQLAPIVKEDEWQLLRNYYDSSYFFSSMALRKSEPVCIELKKIYRQSDEKFIELLNQVRENKLDESSLQELNKRYRPNLSMEEAEGYITLCTHNATAQKINQQRLNALSEALHVFTAEVKNDFPEYAYPTDFNLELKVGAQIMFVKNDISKEKLFFNGKIGQLSRIEKDCLYVKCPEDLVEIPVKKAEWQNVRYSLGADKQVKEDVIGSFIQYPVKLAWAITIHKSQGLTFEKAIIDAQSSFAFGQVYVALSRCKNLEGMILRSPLYSNSIKTDPGITAFTSNISEQEPSLQLLQQEKRHTQQELMQDLFDFKELRKLMYDLRKKTDEQTSSLLPSTVEQMHQLPYQAEEEVLSVSNRFIPQLNQYFYESTLPEENQKLQERLKKASSFFAEKLDTHLFRPISQLDFDCDNKAVKQELKESREKLLLALYSKINCFQSCREGFNSLRYLQTLANSEMDFKLSNLNNKDSKDKAPTGQEHAELFVALKAWRDQLAEESDSEKYEIIAQKTIQELCHYLPLNLEELSQIKGIGPFKLKQFGEDIIQIIFSYCSRNGIERRTSPSDLSKRKEKTQKEAGASDRKSFELFRKGYSMEQIATDRKLTITTIEGHLVKCVQAGLLALEELVDEHKIRQIEAFIEEQGTKPLKEMREIMGDAFSYNELRLVVGKMRKQSS